MSLLSNGNILKALAVLVIAFFVFELFVVYLYSSPSTPAQPSVTGSDLSSANEVFVGTSLVPFSIRTFTGSLLFVCNVSSFPTAQFSGILGNPVKLGDGPSGGLYLARTVNDSISNSTFLHNFSTQLFGVCGKGVIFRETSLVFNGTSDVGLASLSNSSSRANVSRAKLLSYVDQFGRSPVGLVVDLNAKQGDVVQVQFKVTLQGGSIVPGSLVLEQSEEAARSTQSLVLNATVSSFTGKQFLYSELPWENRFDKPVVSGVISETFSPTNVVIVNTSLSDSLFNFSFVNRTARQGDQLALLINGNLTDKQIVLNALSALNFTSANVTFLPTFYSGEFNGSVVHLPSNSTSSASSTLISEAIVSPVNRSVNSLELPESFSAFVLQNTSLGQQVVLIADIVVENGQVIQVKAKEQSITIGG